MQNNNPHGPTSPRPPSKEEEDEEREKKKKNAPKDEPTPKKKEEAKKEDGPDIGGGLYQSLKKAMGGASTGLLWKMLSKLNPFRSTPKPPEDKIKQEEKIKLEQEKAQAQEKKEKAEKIEKESKKDKVQPKIEAGDGNQANAPKPPAPKLK